MFKRLAIIALVVLAPLTMGPTAGPPINAENVGRALYPRTAQEIAAGVAPVNFRYEAGRNVIDPRRYDSTNGVNLGPAINVANTVAAQYPRGVTIQLPAGNVNMTTGATISVAGVFVKCSPFGTVINFNPAGTAVAFTFSAGASSIVQVGIDGCIFNSGNSVDKTAIRIDDGRDTVVRNIGIADGSWLGTGSIALHTRGRDTLRVEKFHVITARPIVIDGSTNHATIDADHFHYTDMEIGTNLANGRVIEVTNGTHLSNVTFDGYQAWLLGEHGFYMNDSATTIASYQLTFRGVRTEQATNAAGYSIFINTTVQDVQDVLIDNAHLDPSRNGVNINRVNNLTIMNSTFTGAGGRTNLLVPFGSFTELQLINTHIQSGSTNTLSNAVLVHASKLNTSNTALPKNALYIYDETATVSQRPWFGYGNTKRWSYQGALAIGATLNTPVTTANTTIALINVAFYSATGPFTASCSATFNASGTLIKLAGSANCVIAAAGVEIRVVNNGGGNLVVSNASGVAGTVLIDLLYQ